MNKDELIEKYRDINVDWDGWWDYEYETFIEDMKKKGVPIDADNISHSGFGSQGDGASFTCRIDGDDLEVFCKEHFLFRDYPLFEQAVKAGLDPDIRMERNSHHYSHHSTVSCIVQVDCYFGDLLDRNIDDGDIRVAVANVLDKDLYDVLKDIEADANEILRDYMKELYSKLYDEYFHLISDEVVWETIEANGFDLVCPEKGCTNEVKEQGEVCLECKLEALEYAEEI